MQLHGSGRRAIVVPRSALQFRNLASAFHDGLQIVFLIPDAVYLVFLVRHRQEDSRRVGILVVFSDDAILYRLPSESGFLYRF